MLLLCVRPGQRGALSQERACRRDVGRELRNRMIDVRKLVGLWLFVAEEHEARDDAWIAGK